MLGNCGFGIAPCPPPLREAMLKNLSVVEGMDLDALERVPPYANVAALAGHSTIRTAVMGDDAGVAPLPAHRAGVVALSDAGAHLIYFCDAGFGLHFLAHWVRETGTFTLEEGVRRLTSDPARKYRIPARGAIAPGMWADLLLFDPARVGVSALEKRNDLPGGGARMTRRPLGVHGVWVNGLQVHDGVQYSPLPDGPGRVLRTFDS